MAWLIRAGVTCHKWYQYHRLELPKCFYRVLCMVFFQDATGNLSMITVESSDPMLSVPTNKSSSMRKSKQFWQALNSVLIEMSYTLALIRRKCKKPFPWYFLCVKLVVFVLAWTKNRLQSVVNFGCCVIALDLYLNR